MIPSLRPFHRELGSEISGNDRFVILHVIHRRGVASEHDKWKAERGCTEAQHAEYQALGRSLAEIMRPRMRDGFSDTRSLYRITKARSSECHLYTYRGVSHHPLFRYISLIDLLVLLPSSASLCTDKGLLKNRSRVSGKIIQGTLFRDRFFPSDWLIALPPILRHLFRLIRYYCRFNI